MNYLPIFSPTDGVIGQISSEYILITTMISDDAIIYCPIEGIISINSKSISSINLSINNQNLNKSIGMVINGQNEIGISKEIGEFVSYNEPIGKIINNSSIKIELNNMHGNVVSIGSKVIGGLTIIAYIVADKNINYKLDARNQLIILTTPHAKCNYKIEKYKPHNCDFYAEKFANKLEQILSENKREIILYHGTINRTEIDLNRDASLDTNFRKRIRNRIKMKIKELAALDEYQNYSNIIYVIDCHSFPSESFSNIRIKNPEIAILFVS